MDNAGDVIQAPRRADVAHASWDDLRALTDRGHEIGSHTISHPRLDALDDANIRDELVRSRDEIERHLGRKYTFSVELPFGIEDERAVRHGLDLYEVSRNRMPEPWLAELNRSSREDPTVSDRPYVQWQRGLVDETTGETWRTWVETTAGDDSIWLVLVIHGVEGIGWEAIPRETLAALFDHLASSRDRLWVATFQDVAKYMRARMAATVSSTRAGDAIRVTVTHALDPTRYDAPLTLETRVPTDWRHVRVVQGTSTTTVASTPGEGFGSVRYRALPNAGAVVLTRD
jgi:hypothetical protein